MAIHLVAILLLVSIVSHVDLAAQNAPPTRDQPDFAKPLITEAPAAIPPATGDSVTATETTVLATHDAMTAAIENLEFDRLATMIIRTDRGALIADGRITLAHDDMLETLRREFAPLRGVHHTFTRRHVSIFSPTTALVVAEGAITAHGHDGATFSRPFAQTLVFLKIDDTWKIAHLHSSTPPATLGK